MIDHPNLSPYRLKRDLNNSNFFLIKGHPKYCPTWTTCRVSGSTWGGSMIKVGFVGVDMHLEVILLSHNLDASSNTITTSKMKQIEECQVED